MLAESLDSNAQVMISDTSLVARESDPRSVLAEGSEERVYELVVTRLEEVVEELSAEDTEEIAEETVEDVTEETEESEETETEKEQVIQENRDTKRDTD